MRVRFAQRIDLGDVGRIAGEFEDHPVRRLRVDRPAIAVVGLAEFLAGLVEAALELVIGLVADLERDVIVAADLGRRFRLCQRVHLRIGELKERQRAAIGKAEECVAEIDLTAQIGAVGPLAPGRDQRDAEQILDKAPVGLVVLHHIGVVVQAQRQLVEQFGLGARPGFDRVHRHPPLR